MKTKTLPAGVFFILALVAVVVSITFVPHRGTVNTGMRIGSTIVPR